MDTPNYFIYVLFSTIADKHYVGMSEDPSARLKQHNNGKSQFTKSYRPWEIIYTEFAGSREDARRLEKYYKTGAGRVKIKKILAEQELHFNKNS
jgi:putative endonuclease